MSSHQRKRHGGAVDSRPAHKRSTGGTLQSELRDLEERGTLSFEPEVIDLTGESPEPDVIIMSDNESAVQVREQSQQQLQVSRASENSPEQPAMNDEEDPRDIDDYWMHESDYPYWLDEDSEDGEQDQQQLQVSSASKNSPGLPAGNDEEDPRDIDDYWMHESDYPYWLDEDSEDGEQDQQQPWVSSASKNSPELPARNDEEASRAYVTDRLTL